jgi:hypothetical protein
MSAKESQDLIESKHTAWLVEISKDSLKKLEVLGIIESHP